MTHDRQPTTKALHPDLHRAHLATLPFHWRWALPLWRLALRAATAPTLAGVAVSDQAAEGARLRIYRPHVDASGGALLWLHGGGLILGTPRMDDARCAEFARELGLIVVSVDYRLAPEHPYPAALDDAHTAWGWLLGAAAALGVDRARVAVGGASAGGGLAAALAQRLRDEGTDQPAAQLLLYPMLDDRTAARVDLDGAGHLVWHNRSNRAGWSAYLAQPPGAEALPAYAAAARCPDLVGLPPAWIGVGDLDLFQHENRVYALRLGRDGVEVVLHEVAGAPHGFDALAPAAPLARAFAKAQWAFLRERLAAAPLAAGAPS